MAKKYNKGWNEPDSLEDSLGTPQPWFGADYRGRRWNASASGTDGRGCLEYSANKAFAGGDMGKPTCPSTPSAADVGAGASKVISPIHSRGDCYYSASNYEDVLGKPQNPGKP